MYRTLSNLRSIHNKKSPGFVENLAIQALERLAQFGAAQSRLQVMLGGGR
jgi:hypothetical protein